RAVLRGEIEVRMRHVADKVERKVRQKSSRNERVKQSIDIAPHESVLWESLRNTRAALAKEQGVPAYRIFTDATLLQMLRDHPQSLSELATISGVGEMKLTRYGEEFLAVLTAF
ncbi:MAG: HRDC domain-containing protein, partial [Dokdonella sp.]